MIKYSELKKISLNELYFKFNDLKDELINLKFQHATNQLENFMRLSQVRKDIARVLTEIQYKKNNNLK